MPMTALDGLETRLEKLDQTMPVAFQNVITEMQQEIRRVSVKCNSIEERNRRTNLRVYGLDSPSPESFIQLSQTKLNLASIFHIYR